MSKFNMDIIIPVFQFEVRFNHILNFSQIARNLLAPYVKLTHSIKINKQNTVEETYFLNFEEDNYVVIVSWDRMVFRGQGGVDAYKSKNSPFESIFLNIFQKISKLEEFGSVQKSLFYGIAISEHKEADSLLEDIYKKTLAFNPYKIDKDLSDIAIVLESKNDTSDKSCTFGPYWGVRDIIKRPIKPINIEALGDIDFAGVMLEYKRVTLATEISLNHFVEHFSEFKESFKKIWKNQ